MNYSSFLYPWNFFTLNHLQYTVVVFTFPYCCCPHSLLLVIYSDTTKLVSHGQTLNAEHLSTNPEWLYIQSIILHRIRGSHHERLTTKHLISLHTTRSLKIWPLYLFSIPLYLFSIPFPIVNLFLQKKSVRATFNGSCKFYAMADNGSKARPLPLGESHTTETLLRRNEGT